MGAATKSEARQQAENIVSNWSTGTFLTGWVPGSGFLSAGADQVMIRQVADCYGVGVFDMKAVTAQLGGVLGASLGGAAAAELFTLVPVFGWFVKATTLAAKAQLIGEGVIDYFESNSRLPD